MNGIKIKPVKTPPEFTAEVPGSKSIMNRALLLAALSENDTLLHGTVYSSDTEVFVNALKTLGYRMEPDKENHTTLIGKRIPLERVKNAEINVGSAGTAARFLTAMLALSGGSFYMDSSEQMKSRPMKPLLEALELLGARIGYRGKPYCFPFYLAGYTERDIKEVPLNIDQSSQFLSALLMTGVTRKNKFMIRLTGNRTAKSYVEITEQMMESFGVTIRKKSDCLYEVPASRCLQRKEYRIEPDISSACYFYALAALTGGSVTVRNVSRKSMQGDIRFVALLEQMGCTVDERPEGLNVTGPENGEMNGVDIDMSDFSDQTMTLAAMAPFLKGKTVIRNVGHIRGQESDRLSAVSSELNRLGIEVTESENGLVIVPGEIKPAKIRTYEDHRMAMAFSLIGCMREGIEILDPDCCKKTFPKYFEILGNAVSIKAHIRKSR